jgi:YrbI family 3-deoxy-D-manno-octulosonate 8-phosphate phosphatase
VILTGKRSEAVARRAAELGIEQVVQGSEDKLSDLRKLLDSRGVALRDVAMIGDDLPDLPVLLACGYPIAVGSAAAEVLAAARYVTKRAGGDGAVREAIEHLLSDGGGWAQAVRHYRQLAEGER